MFTFDSYWFLSISSSLLISGSDNRGVYFDTQLNCALIIALFSKFANYLNVLCGQNSRKRTSVVLSTSVSAESSVGWQQLVWLWVESREISWTYLVGPNKLRVCQYSRHFHDEWDKMDSPHKGRGPTKRKISDSFKKATDIHARLNYTNAIMCSSSN